MGKDQIIITIILFNLFFIAFILAIITFIRQYRVKKKEHVMILNNQHEEHQKEILATQIEIQNQTMQHIGREIHDNIGQKLTLASLYTQQLAYENKAPHINENIESISAIINQSLSELRALSKSLTDDRISNSSIVALLQHECETMQDLQKCTVYFNCDEDKIELSYPVKSVLVRIAQEFMQNSIKHSNCESIVVDLHKNEKLIELQLRDNGQGFDSNQINNKGIGLMNMKKRTEIIGGKFNFESNPKHGTRMTIAIPI